MMKVAKTMERKTAEANALGNFFGGRKSFANRNISRSSRGCVINRAPLKTRKDETGYHRLLRIVCIWVIFSSNILRI